MKTIRGTKGMSNHKDLGQRKEKLRRLKAKGRGIQKLTKTGQMAQKRNQRAKKEVKGNAVNAYMSSGPGPSRKQPSTPTKAAQIVVIIPQISIETPKKSTAHRYVKSPQTRSKQKQGADNSGTRNKKRRLTGERMEVGMVSSGAHGKTENTEDGKRTLQGKSKKSNGKTKKGHKMGKQRVPIREIMKRKETAQRKGANIKASHVVQNQVQNKGATKRNAGKAKSAVNANASNKTVGNRETIKQKKLKAGNSVGKGKRSTEKSLKRKQGDSKVEIKLKTKAIKAIMIVRKKASKVGQANDRSRVANKKAIGWNKFVIGNKHRAVK